MNSAQISSKVYEVTISHSHVGPFTVDILKNLIVSAGVSLEGLIEQEKQGVKALVFYCASLKQAQDIECKCKTIRVKGIKIGRKVLYRDDWLTRWKKDWKPFKLTSHIDVVPVWCKDDYVFGKRDSILLDTIVSFGTGLHETTRFMAQFIEELRGKFDSCLDIGTGTGILAIVALKGGAKEVWAIDLDELCVKAASTNFKVNGYAHKNIILADLDKFKSGQKFDFVCANLVTHDLVKMKRKILAFVKPGGWLAVSGVSLENLPLLRRGFKDLPLRCVKIRKGTKWSAVLFRRNQD